jgi:hypothetical protein
LTSIDTPLPNGSPRNRLGFGGETGREARAGVAGAIARCLTILNSGTPLSAAAAVAAAGVLIQAGRDREAGLLSADRAKVVAKLRELVMDYRTPDATAVDAARLLLAATGRHAYRKGN